MKDMPIIMAHPSIPWQDEALSVATHKPNVYIDLSGWSPKYFPKILIQYANRMLKHKMLFGSDWPIVEPDAIAAMRSAITGRIADGSVFHESETISPRDALEAHTRHPARCVGFDDAGTIAPGRRADLVVLDRDPLTCDWHHDPPQVVHGPHRRDRGVVHRAHLVERRLHGVGEVGVDHTAVATDHDSLIEVLGHDAVDGVDHPRAKLGGRFGVGVAIPAAGPIPLSHDTKHLIGLDRVEDAAVLWQGLPEVDLDE